MTRQERTGRSSLALAALALWVPGAALAEIPCTYHAAPVAEDGGRVPAGAPFAKTYNTGTPDQPIPVADFWKRKLAKPGTVLCLMDGEYRGADSMVRPPPGKFPGQAGKRIEVRAVNDGRVWIDGELRHLTLDLLGQDYWTIRGLNLFNSRGSEVSVSGRRETRKSPQQPVHDVILRRLVAWQDFLPYGSEADYDKIGGHNIHIYNVAYAHDVLVEDCAGFGWARKIFQNYRTNRLTFRRGWARWDGRYPYRRGNKFGFSCSYQGYDALCENVIATTGGSADPAAAPETYDPGIHLIATDGGNRPEPWLEPAGRDPMSLGLRIYGSLAYTGPESRYTKVAGFHVGGAGYPVPGQKGVLIENSVASLESVRPAANLANCGDDPEKYPDGCSWMRGDDRARSPLEGRRLTLASSRTPPIRIRKDWQLEQVEIIEGPRAKDIYAEKNGASLCRQYVEGRETPIPLWPWPMQDRIRAATERSNWRTADVMGELKSLFGEPPARCRRPTT